MYRTLLAARLLNIPFSKLKGTVTTASHDHHGLSNLHNLVADTVRSLGSEATTHPRLLRTSWASPQGGYPPPIRKT